MDNIKKSGFKLISDSISRINSILNIILQVLIICFLLVVLKSTFFNVFSVLSLLLIGLIIRELLVWKNLSSLYFNDKNFVRFYQGNKLLLEANIKEIKFLRKRRYNGTFLFEVKSKRITVRVARHWYGNPKIKLMDDFMSNLEYK